ncbi:hypothetical protein ACN3XK_51965 [Actinomadura welshii]
MNDKPGKDKAAANTEPEPDERPARPAGAESSGKGQKKKPGDAARKMRAMFKG